MLLPVLLFAQDTGNSKRTKDSSPLKQTIPVKKDSAKKNAIIKDSIKPVNRDSIKVDHKDSLKPTGNDSLKNVVKAKDSSGKNSTLNLVGLKKNGLKDSLQGKDSATALINNTSTIDSLNKLKNDSIELAKKNMQKNSIQLMAGEERHTGETDLVFYILIFLLFFLGLVKASFPKYVNSIFSLSFQATFRQVQTKDQMEQNFFPAFMLNVLFVLCGGLFITLLAEMKGWSELPFWELFVYSTVVLFAIYFIKYIVISFTGWVFNTKEAAAEYRFVVFLINKLLAILLLPLLFLITYANDQIKNIAITIVICIAVLALVIRYLVSLSRIRKNLNVTAFHFFIYLCAAEIVPLLVIYKILFLQTSNS